MKLTRFADALVAAALLASFLLAAGCISGAKRSSATQPFGGKPQAIPGTIEAEHFDEGAEGASHHDLDAENQGAPYRKNTSVDIEARPDAENGHGVGWTRAGEWLNYTVEVASDGSYTIEIPVASPAKGGTFHFEVGGKDVTGPIEAPNTGSWGKLKFVTVKGVKLRRGVQTLRLKLDKEAETKSVADIDCFIFKRE